MRQLTAIALIAFGMTASAQKYKHVGSYTFYTFTDSTLTIDSRRGVDTYELTSSNLSADNEIYMYQKDGMDIRMTLTRLDRPTVNMRYDVVDSFTQRANTVHYKIRRVK